MAKSRSGSRHRWLVLVAFLLGVAASAPYTGVWAQQGTALPEPSGSPQAGTRIQNPAQEIGEETPTFKVKVNLVQVRVVVRDAKGNAVGNLKREDFQLFDQGKPQVIQQFTPEETAQAASAAHSPQPLAGAAGDSGTPAPPVIPDRYVAYLFDDIHGSLSDLVRVRDAALRHLSTLRPADRAAIFTTSGRGNLDFTGDRARLSEALRQLQPRPIAGSPGTDCPSISPFQAELILNSGCSRMSQTAAITAQEPALAIATAEAASCGPSSDPGREACSSARRVLVAAEHESRVALFVLQDVVGRMTALSGQRNILLLSAGFYAPDLKYRYDAVIEQALRAQVTISALDARGLYTEDTLGDISKPTTMIGGALATRRVQLIQAAARADEEVLGQLAYGTGGSYFHGSNDFDRGFQELAAPVEYAYVLGFSPGKLKLDGKFHELKVKVTGASPFTVQARKGYYAPKQAADEALEAKAEIEEALLSRLQIHDFLTDLQLGLINSGGAKKQLGALARIDVKGIRFRRDGDVHANHLTLIFGLFDHDGKYITARQQDLALNLKDDTLARALKSGIGVTATFDVAPGGYLVRLVIRDSEGRLSTADGSITVP